MSERASRRHSTWDAVFVLLAIGQGVVLVAFPVLPVVALGIWWNSNTISHNFIHRPFFRGRMLNQLFSFYETVLLGIPQSIWKSRHLAHHADVPWRLRITPRSAFEVILVAGLWTALILTVPSFFLAVYLPGYALGLTLCWLHGFFEHASGTTSHRGALYNWLFFNDGYHIEHHDSPGTHWTELPKRTAADARISRWPAVLRWIDALSLDSLERLVLRSKRLQDFVLQRHTKAFKKLLPDLKDPVRVAIVGGGLFPRTAIILQRLLPHAKLVVIDASARNLETAESFLDESVEFVHAYYDPSIHHDFDLVVIPLAYIGDRHEFYRVAGSVRVVVHDWIWRPRGRSVVVSCLMLKRLNLICRAFERVPTDSAARRRKWRRRSRRTSAEMSLRNSPVSRSGSSRPL